MTDTVIADTGVSWVLRTQVATCRTQNGRDIGQEMWDAIRQDASEYEAGRLAVCECSGCRLVAGSDRFTQGCPNCGSKVFEEHATREVKQ